MPMKIERRPERLRELTARWRKKGATIALVPTMGALHAAHLSLIKRARLQCDRVIVSIFVNPKQFGPGEDLDRYPRPFRQDAAHCRSAGVSALYHPRTETMYPEGFATTMTVAGLTDVLCGRSRPGHFAGVATVVLKLLTAARPDRLYLGEKDFQQLVVVRRMVRDMDLGIRVVGCPTVREKDGLALSSRNANLSSRQRSLAPRLHRALRLGAASGRRRGRTPAQVRAVMRNALRAIPGLKIDYLEIVNAKTLRRPARLKGPMRLMGAVLFGKTRIIDNIAFTM